jgi:hypothetical protein
MKLQAMLVASVLALSGCASAPSHPQAMLFENSPATVLAPPPADKAQVVFVMPKNLFVETAAVELYDVGATDSTLLALVPSHGKTVHLVAPGRHQFMTRFGAAGTHIMDADLVAGKRYYVLMRFIYGGGFQLRPIRTSGPSDYSAANKDFPSWLSSTRFVAKTPAGDEWYATNKPVVMKAQAGALEVWGKKSPEQRAELTLNANDAFAD